MIFSKKQWLVVGGLFLVNLLVATSIAGLFGQNDPSRDQGLDWTDDVPIYEDLSERTIISNSQAYASNLINNEDFIGIEDTDAFSLIGSDPGYPLDGNYVLESDLDFTNYTWDTLVENFIGIFDGAGFTIENMTQLEVDGAIQYGLFSSVGFTDTENEVYQSATIRNLTIDGFTGVADTDFGVLASTSSFNVIIDNVTVTNAFVRSNSGRAGGLIGSSNEALTLRHVTVQDSIITGQSATGGLVGNSDGTILIENTQSVDNEIYGRDGAAGGFVGYARGVSVYQSENHSTVITENQPVGGIIGENDVEIGSLFERVLNTGTIVSLLGQNAGGIIGLANDDDYAWLNFESVFNTGNIYGVSYVGGIIGDISLQTTFNQVVNVGNVTATAERAGGIVGDFNGGDFASFRNIYNRGVIRGTNEVGGLFGYFGGAGDDATYTNLYNAGAVQGITNKIGGLFGYINGGDYGVLANAFNVGEVTTEGNVFRGVGQIVGEINDNLILKNIYFYWDGVSDVQFAAPVLNEAAFSARAILDLDRFTQEDFIFERYWNMTDVWTFESGDYQFPVLRFELTETSTQVAIESLDETYFERFEYTVPA